MLNILSNQVTIYGVEHVLFLVVSALIVFLLILFTKLFIKSGKIRILVVRIIGGILLISLILNRIAIAIHRNNITGLLPDSFCGISSLMLSLLAIFYKKDNALLTSFALISLLGGLLNDFYPTYFNQNPSFFYFATFTGMLHHTIGVMLSLYLIFFNLLSFNYKKWYVLPLTFAVILSYSALIIELFKLDDASNIMYPMISNTILYGPFIALLATILNLIVYFILYLVDRKKIKNNSTNS